MTEGAAIREVPFAPLVWLFLVAAVLGLLSVLLPHDPITRDAVVLGISAAALLIAVVLPAFRRRGIGRVGVAVLLTVATAAHGRRDLGHRRSAERDERALHVDLPLRRLRPSRSAGRSASRSPARPPTSS